MANRSSLESHGKACVTQADPLGIAETRLVLMFFDPQGAGLGGVRPLNGSSLGAVPCPPCRWSRVTRGATSVRGPHVGRRPRRRLGWDNPILLRCRQGSVNRTAFGMLCLPPDRPHQCDRPMHRHAATRPTWGRRSGAWGGLRRRSARKSVGTVRVERRDGRS